MATEVPKIPDVIAQVRADPGLDDAIGGREGGEPQDELQHFYLCKACHQPVDMRDLAAVFHHEDEGHEPLPASDAVRLWRITQHLNMVLEQAELGGGRAAEPGARHAG